MAKWVLIFALVLVSAAALPSKKGGCAAPTATPKPIPNPCFANHGSTVDCSKAGANLTLEERQTGLYYFDRSVKTWSEAYEFCKTNNMHLANVYNQAIYDDLWLSADGPNNHYHYWVGGSDINFDTTDVRWTDGTPVNQSLWVIPPEPSSDNCAMLCFPLHAIPCNGVGSPNNGFICQVPQCCLAT
ncbi:C-type lectin domain family 4 member K-like [Neocloeon triangulifer]|uniref:C-type lectin domain family 4 member K-like n=1 Tax=Neocloeon triangulifer TaxID=2078957 RepID=UPI00286EB577|nr:C-type lectin domain family 4 member K-like [Neocloeon triangulifer]